MQREIIRPQVDVPVIVKLGQGPEGKEREGPKGGIDYQYIVNDDAAVMWLPREARDLIVKSGAQAGDLIQIVKTLHGRQAVYSIQVLPPPTMRNYRVEPATPPLRTNGCANGAPHTTTIEMPRELPAPAAPPAVQQPVQPPPQHRPGAQQLQGAICAAIDAALGGEEYARNKGRALTFSEESIRAFALTLLIGEQKAGRS